MFKTWAGRRQRNGGRMTRRRLSYANVTATMALVIAVSGGAALASGYVITSTRQIKPSVIKALRGATGPRGKQGAMGPAGVTGFTSTLPAGKTEVGTWGGFNLSAPSGYPYYAPISFNIPLTNAPVVNIIGFQGAPTAACPGTPAAPSAASGNVCVYIARQVNSGVGTQDAGSEANVGTFGTYGGIVIVHAGAMDYGTWAVTG